MTNPFLVSVPVDHEVNGTTQKFYPLRARVLFQLRGMAKPVAKALSVLMGSSQNDIGKETVQVSAPDGGSQIRTSLQPITAELAKTRHDQKVAALEQMVEGVMNDGAATMIAALVIDSMRDAGFRNDAVGQKAFLDDVSAPVLWEMLCGVAKANQRLFDPLKGRVAEVTAALKSNLNALARGADETELPSDSPEAPSRETATTHSG